MATQPDIAQDAAYINQRIEEMKLQIEHVPITSVRPHPKNPRKRQKKQLRMIAASYKAHGFLNPVIVDEGNTILAGHGRHEAALRMGLKTVPVIRVHHLTPEQKLTYMLADNKLNTLSSWDMDPLAEIMIELDKTDIIIESTGFETAELDNIIIGAKRSKIVDDALVTLPPAYIPVTKPDDLWELGNHLLYCGNSTHPQSYQKLMGSDIAQMCVADAPYGVPVIGHVKKSNDNKFHEFVQGTTEKELPDLLRGFLHAMAAHLENGAIAYCFMDWQHLEQLLHAAKGLYEYKQLCVWVKSHGGMGSFYRSQHELCAVFKYGDAPHINNHSLGETGRYRTNVWQAPAVQHCENYTDDDINHPTIKPVSLIADAIRDCSRRGGIILDPFGGSGTTLIAAERTNRCARLIELDPIYCDMIIKRWQDLTGKKAVHKQSGEDFVTLTTRRDTNAIITESQAS